MGTTLTGTTPQDTYDSLIKVTDNGPLSGTLKALSDGLGNDSTLSLSTTAASIAGTLAVTGNTGIGTSTPDQIGYGAGKILGVLSPAADATSLQLGIVGSAAATTGTLADINFFGRNGTGAVVSRAILRGGIDGATNSNFISAWTMNAGSLTEKVRITSTGELQLTGNGVVRNEHSSANFSYWQQSSADARLFVQYAQPLIFGTNNTERMRITSAGVVELSQGQIQFPATQVASANANTLDDYEEGTWTIGVSFGNASVGVTTSANTGTYTKIGRQVTVNGYLALTNKGSSTGAARVTGLPFTIANSGTFYSAPTFGQFFNITHTGFVNGFGNVNGTNINIESTSLLGALTSLSDTNFANSSELMISFTYFV